jgi:hypothetical protein
MTIPPKSAALAGVLTNTEGKKKYCKKKRVVQHVSTRTLCDTLVYLVVKEV